MALEKLIVTKETQPKLYHFLKKHPEIFKVFHNIEHDRALSTGVTLASGNSAEIVQVYIENLHLPLLLECSAILPCALRKCGYKALVSGFEYRRYDSQSMSQVAADRAAAIAQDSLLTDNSDNSLYCYYHGVGENVKISQELLSNIRELILVHAANPGEDTALNRQMSFDLVVSARIS
jgi:hypothetical protein